MVNVSHVQVEKGSTGSHYGVKIVNEDGTSELIASFKELNDATKYAESKSEYFGVGFKINP